jgi:hypothetical protein
MRLDGAAKRGQLALLTGIPESNLSAMNTGKRPMTMESARRIVAAVPGLSVLDLGAREEGAAPDARPALSRLAALEDALTVFSEEATARLAVLEEALGLAAQR